jgi:hypothetical protein
MTFAGAVPGVLGAAIREVADLPEHLSNGRSVDPWTEGAPGSLLFTVPGIARYLVENGTSISVAPAPGADPRAVELFLHGPARGSLIHQRGELALEAATVVAPNGVAIAISGASGAGKSTIAAELCRRGWLLLADDITRVTWTRGRALAWPSHDAFKLWRNVCTEFGIDTQDLPRVREGMEKFFVTMTAATSPTVLRAVVRLQLISGLKMGDVRPGREAAALSECVFRWRQIEALRQRDNHEHLSQQITKVCRIQVLTGARDAPVEALADQIAKAAA